MAAGDKWTCNCSSGLHIRSGPGTSYKSVGGLSKGESVTEIEQQTTGSDLWVKHNAGWSCAKQGSNTYMTCEKAPSPTTDTSENSPPPTEEENDGDTEGSGYQPDISDILSFTNSSISNSEFARIKNIAGVFGLPYQFLPSTDPRLYQSDNVENIGYEYASKIIERIPLLLISPGKPNFMTRYSKKNKENILEKLINLGAGNDQFASIEDLVEENGRYYTFEYDQKRYYKFVNPMCRIAAIYLGLQDIKIDGTRLDRMNWETLTQQRIKSIGDFGNFSAVPFYIDTDSSISESFSNSTTQSMIASTVNSVSDMGRELNFLLGYTSAGTGVDILSKDADIASSIENINTTINNLLGNNNFLSSLSKHLTTVASGGKLTFPEIWSDSSFSRSYNCEIKLISPDASKLSVYLNVLVPLFHLLGLVAPQSVRTNPNGYTNPFIIRAIYKGFFNVDMGIITDMSVTKGAECQWTPEGVPTSISINIGIKDLYQAMSITATESTDWKYDTLNNTALMDYIANLCGINIYKPEIARSIEMWYVNNFANRVEDFFQIDIWQNIKQGVQNLIMGIYR